MEILEILLERGAEVDIRNNSGQTALHIAVAKKFTAYFLILNEYKADSNVQVRCEILIWLRNFVNLLNLFYSMRMETLRCTLPFWAETI